MLSQHPQSCAILSQQHCMIPAEFAKLTNELVTPFHRNESSDLTSESIKILSEILKYCSVCLFQELEVRLELHLHPEMDRKMNNPTDDHRPSSSAINLKLL